MEHNYRGCQLRVRGLVWPLDGRCCIFHLLTRRISWAPVGGRRRHQPALIFTGHILWKNGKIVHERFYYEAGAKG